MRGLMMDAPLSISSLIRHADRNHGDTEIVSRTVEGPVHRYTYRDAHARARRLAKALGRLGVEPGDRCATLAWNGHRHFEAYYGISGSGAVCHTINPRLFPPQIAYIVNHARDRLLLVDTSFVPLLEGVADRLESVEGVIVLADEADMPETTLPAALCYETLLEAESDDYDWPILDERSAASLCYSSGTTGNPKGVLYSHRAILLHTYACGLPDSMGLSARDAVMPAVPMFHVNAWGLPYTAPMVGSKLVFPGRWLDGASLQTLIETEEVTISAGVPTIWLGLLQHLQETGKRIDPLQRVVIGGSATPHSMIEAFGEKHGVEVLHAWGMTETTPIGAINGPKYRMRRETPAERYERQVSQGRAVFGIEMKIVDDDEAELAQDGAAFGRLKVRGPWVCSAYFEEDESASHDAEGWMDTGDVATIDRDGFLRVTDRSKDVIKSGGEWISSIELENVAVGHPDVVEAASIGIAHPKWNERPLLLVVRREGSALTRDEMLAYFDGKVAKWWAPDDVVFVDELPHTATGKLLKTRLREDYKNYAPTTA